MPTLEELIAQQRRLLITGIESPLFRLLAALYGDVTPGLIDLAVRLATPGPDEPLTALVARQRAATMAASVAEELARINPQAIGAVQGSQLLALQQGTGQVPAVLQALLPAGSTVAQRVNTVAVQRAAAAVLPGSPVAALFEALPAAVAEQARQTLLRGVLLGRNPRGVGRDLRRVMGGSVWRSQTIARTEVLRAYRGAAQEGQRANRDLLGGWVWISARDTRTCALCWAMHGSRHRVDEVFASHPNCRCSPAPLPRTDPPFILQGPLAFADVLTEAQQRAILGPGRFALYQQGAIDLQDVVGVRTDPRWGRVRYVRSVKSLRRTAARRG